VFRLSGFSWKTVDAGRREDGLGFFEKEYSVGKSGAGNARVLFRRPSLSSGVSCRGWGGGTGLLDFFKILSGG